MVEINFLCVHKKLRSKRLAPVMIKVGRAGGATAGAAAHQPNCVRTTSALCPDRLRPRLQQAAAAAAHKPPPNESRAANAHLNLGTNAAAFANPPPQEITRRVNLTDIWQAAYTAGVVLPMPVAVCRYWHRSLNPKKLIDVGFSSLAVSRGASRRPRGCLGAKREPALRARVPRPVRSALSTAPRKRHARTP
jgi:hypothetical protein